MTTPSSDPAFLAKEAKRFKLKVGVFLFLVQNNQLLLLRRYNTGIADGCHVVPMGGLTDGETITQAILRETHEETSLHLNPKDLHVCHTMHRLHRMPSGYTFPQVDIYFQATTYTGTPTNREPHKCDELKFYPLNALPPTTEPFILHALHCTTQGQPYSEFGWPSPTPEIRRAEPSDLPWINARYAEIGFLPSNYDNEIILIAHINGHKAGLARLVTLTPHHLELGGMYVLPPFRRQGIAHHLLTALLQHAPPTQTIYCLPFQHLLPLYTSHGFTPCPSPSSAPPALLAKHRWCNETYPHPTELLVLQPPRAN